MPAIAALVPVAASGTLRSFALGINDDLRKEIGWGELMLQLASIRVTLTPARATADRSTIKLTLFK